MRFNNLQSTYSRATAAPKNNTHTPEYIIIMVAAALVWLTQDKINVAPALSLCLAWTRFQFVPLTNVASLSGTFLPQLRSRKANSKHWFTTSFLLGGRYQAWDVGERMLQPEPVLGVKDGPCLCLRGRDSNSSKIFHTLLVHGVMPC